MHIKYDRLPMLALLRRSAGRQLRHYAIKLADTIGISRPIAGRRAPK